MGYKPSEIVGQHIEKFVEEVEGVNYIDGLLSQITTRGVGPMATNNLEVNFLVEKESTLWGQNKSIPVLMDAFGLWDVSLRNDLRKSLNSGIRKMLAWTAKHNVSYCKFSESKFNPFFNINNPDDLIEAEDIIEKGWV